MIYSLIFIKYYNVYILLMSNSPDFYCRHHDCEGTMIGSFETRFQRNVHLEEVHRKERDPIQDPM